MYLLEIFNYLPICGIQLKVEHWNLAYFCICADLEQSLNEKEIENLIEFIELVEGNIFPSEEEEKRRKCCIPRFMVRVVKLQKKKNKSIRTY
ncbi:hypothetical protein LQK80_37450 [Bacillus thuringiensis]|nr:hypothetical protein [Bacillus thuringiensis]